MKLSSLQPFFIWRVQSAFWQVYNESFKYLFENVTQNITILFASFHLFIKHLIKKKKNFY